MEIIYVDVLFLLNGAVDYVLLLGAARLAGGPLHRLRYLVGAVLGGVYAAALFFPGLEFLGALPCRAAALVLMAVAAYGDGGDLLRRGALFLVLSCVLGGGVLAMGYLGSRGAALPRGMLYSAVDVKVVLVSAAFCYLVVALVLGGAARRSGGLVPVQLELGGKSLDLTALRDTGNTLRDPATGVPVLVAEGAAMSALFPPGELPCAAQLRDPVGCVERLGAGPLGDRLRLVPYRAVGVDSGVLLAVRPDRAWVEGESQQLLVALSPTAVDDGGGFCALIGG